jgi:mycothiol synthase
MTSSLPDGFSVRPLTTDDAPAVDAIARAADVAVLGESDSSVEDLLDWWRLVDLEHSSWLVETDGRAAAAAVGFARGESFDIDGYVHPDFQGRGLGAALLRITEERARELGAARIHNACLAGDGVAVDLLERAGYHDARRFYRMVIDLDGSTPDPQPPEGLAVDTFREGDARAYYDALTEAFEDEWGFHATPFDEWRRLRLEAPDFDPNLWFVVRDGGEIAAVLRAEERRSGIGWIGALGVRRPWRKRGLGLVLLQHAFAEFRRRGETRVGLGVDAQNPTGATRLYERAGMRVHWEAVIYEKELA